MLLDFAYSNTLHDKVFRSLWSNMKRPIQIFRRTCESILGTQSVYHKKQKGKCEEPSRVNLRRLFLRARWYGQLHLPHCALETHYGSALLNLENLVDPHARIRLKRAAISNSYGLSNTSKGTPGGLFHHKPPFFTTLRSPAIKSLDRSCIGRLLPNFKPHLRNTRLDHTHLQCRKEDTENLVIYYEDFQGQKIP